MALILNAQNYYNSNYDSNDSFEVGNDAGESVAGAIRFTGITIAQGTQIQSATLKIWVGSKGSGSGDLHATIKGIDEDNTSDFSGSPFGRPETTAQDQSYWSLPSEGSYSDHGITSIVQEIVDRAGWTSGNAMGFYVYDTSSPTDVWVYDYMGLTDCQLEIVLSSASASPSRSPSRSVSRSPSQTPSASPSPSPSPSPAPPKLSYGMAISKDGYNVRTATIYQKVFDSAKGILGTRQTSTFQDTTDANGLIDDGEAHGLPYIPIVFCTVTCYDGTVINVPGSYESTWNDDEVLVETFGVRVNATGVYFTASAIHSETFQGGVSTPLSGQSYTFKILYCFNELSIE